MSSLSNALSAHPSAWTVEAGSGIRGEDPKHAATLCHHCGQPLQGWQEPYHLNDDHADTSPGNVVPSCPLCHLQQHLNRSTIDSEAVLIWMPEMTQRALIVLARAAHIAMAREGIAPHVTSLPGRQTPIAVNAAFATIRALLGRSTVAEQLLGSSSPKILGAALMSLPDDVYADRTGRLGGLRLLPRGRLFRGSHDIYGQILATWATPHTN